MAIFEPAMSVEALSLSVRCYIRSIVSQRFRIVKVPTLFCPFASNQLDGGLNSGLR